MATILYFPWIQVEEPITIGEFQLKPVNRKTIKNFQANEQKALETIKNMHFHSINNPNYKSSFNKQHTIDSFTVAIHNTGTSIFNNEMNDDSIEKFLQIKEVLFFDFCSHQRFIFNQVKYFNFDSFSSYAQKIEGERFEDLVYQNKRFDGISSSYLTVDLMSVIKPNHVLSGIIKNNEEFCNELYSLTNEKTEISLFVRNYNQSFTDNPSISCGKDMNSIVNCLEKILNSKNFTKIGKFKSLNIENLGEYYSDILLNKTQRFKKNQELYDESSSIINCYFEDVYNLRNHYAHGNQSLRKSLWSINEHKLIFGIYGHIFFKLWLKNIGIISINFRLSPLDRKIIKNFNNVLSEENLYSKTETNSYKLPQLLYGYKEE